MPLRELVVALFVLGAVLLTWPFLTIFNHARAVLGIPLLVLYLFAVWAVMIAAAFWVTRRLDTRP
jgi:hypothetical protein